MRPVIAACVRSGEVVIWTKNRSENWAEFAPDFVELEENVEYEEREDEFDIVWNFPSSSILPSPSPTPSIHRSRFLIVSGMMKKMRLKLTSHRCTRLMYGVLMKRIR